MVRIGLVRKAQTVAETTPMDIEMDDSSSTGSSTNEGQVMPEDYHMDVRNLPFSTSSSMMLDVVGDGKCFSELVRDATELSRNLSSGRQSFATLPQVPTESSLQIQSQCESQRNPIEIRVVHPSMSAALKKLQIHPTGAADKPQLAHGLSFKSSWKPTCGDFVSPSYSTVHPNTTNDCMSSAAVLNIDQVMGAQGVAPQPLSVLCRYAVQNEDHNPGKISFNLSSASNLRSSILDEVAISFSAASNQRIKPSGSTEFLRQSGMEHASFTVKLLTALFGNDVNDDAYALKDPPMKTSVLGNIDTSSKLTVAYEESNRRRRLNDWLMTYGNINSKRIGDDTTNIERDQIVSGRRISVNRSCRKTKRFAESVLLLTATADEDVRKLLREDYTSRSLILEKSKISKIDSGSWIQDFHQYLSLSDRNSEPTLRGLVADYFENSKQCRPPYYEILSQTGIQHSEQIDEILLNGNEKHDICWYLIQLWAGQGSKTTDITAALCDPMTWQHSYGDYSLNWIVCLLLSNAPTAPCSIPEDRFVSLTVAFSEQLANMGAWQWAVFVALTIPSEETRRRIVVRIIMRNVSYFATSNMLSLHSITFQVPKQWIEEALGLVTPIPPVQKRAPEKPIPLSSYIELRSKVDGLLSGIYDTV